MDTKVHCEHCGSVLRVPVSAAGHWAKCPSCKGKFKIPDPKDLLEETVSTWIEEDVEELNEEVDEQYKNLTLAEREQLQQRQQERQANTVQELKQVLQTHAKNTVGPSTAAPPPPVGAKPVGPAAPVAKVTIPAPVKPPPPKPKAATSAPAPAPQPVAHAPRPAAAQTVEEPTGNFIPGAGEIEAAPDYPNELFPTRRRPHMVVASCDQTGVTLAFDCSYLEHIGFRLSMPARCVFSSHAQRTELLARPLAFCDRSQAVAQSAHMVEAGHEARLSDGQNMEEMLRSMGFIQFLPRPFDHVMPYYVSTARSGQSLSCWTRKRPEDGGITCYVGIADGFYALDWLGNVNGNCGQEYLRLSRDVRLLWSDAWRSLPEEIRSRLSAWGAFEPGECFRHYVNDADFGKKDIGLAGIVVTDRRVIFHKYHRTGSLRFAEQPKMVVRPDQGFAAVTACLAEGHVRAASLHLDDVPLLIEAVRDTGLELDLNLST